MSQVQQLLALRPSSCSSSSSSPSYGMLMPTFIQRRQFIPKFHVFRANSLSSNFHKLTLPTSRSSPLIYPHHPTPGFRLFCKSNDSDSMSQLELGQQFGRRKPEKRVNAVFWIILLNLAIYVADHIFLVRDVKALYLFHNQPAWYQFVTAAFCHANWNHLSSNLFFLYIFGKLVEEEEGSFALWLSYILTGQTPPRS